MTEKMNEIKAAGNSTYPLAKVSCFVEKEGSKFEVQCFVGVQWVFPVSL